MKLRIFLHKIGVCWCESLTETQSPSNCSSINYCPLITFLFPLYSAPSTAPGDLHGARVTAMLLQQPPDPCLWVGLSSGHVILINAATHSADMVVRRHVSAVREIQSVKATGESDVVHTRVRIGSSIHCVCNYMCEEAGSKFCHRSRVTHTYIGNI